MTAPWDHLTFTNSSPAVDRAAIEAVATRLKLPFPDEYVAFLLAHNGGRVSPREFPITGCRRSAGGMVGVFFNVGTGDSVDLAGEYRTFRRRIPPGLLPIASDPGGNLICLACSGERAGQVLFWEQAFEANTDEGEKVGWGNVFLIAASLADFFRVLS